MRCQYSPGITRNSAGDPGLRRRFSGTLRPVLGAATASVVLVPVRRGDDQPIWCVLDVDQVRVEGSASLDLTRRVGVVAAEEAIVVADHQLPGLSLDRIREVAVTLAAHGLVGRKAPKPRSGRAVFA